MNQREAYEDLSFIRRVMDDSRSVVVHDGRSFIIWGILVAAGLASSYVLAGTTMHSAHAWLWTGVVAVGWLWSTLDRRRIKALSRAETFAGRMLWSVWLACGISMTLTGVASFFIGAFSPYVLPSLTAFILGVGYFMTGRLMRFPWVQVLAGCWWFGGILLLFVHGRLVLLLYAALMLAFQVVPGLLLQRMARREMVGSRG